MTQQNGSPLLEAENITKRYGALAAIDGLSFSLMSGEVLGIGGPNGAGKTTLFDAISGITPVTSGTIRFQGQDITRAKAHKLCHLGIARTFQLNAGFDSMTARENVLTAAYFGASSRLLPGWRVDKVTTARVDEALDFVNMRDRQHEVVESMPVMDRKLLMVAGALVTQPRIIMMDEPVGGLTSQETNQMIELVRALREQGVTIVLIEHVMRFLTTLADRIMIMHHGEKIYDGSPEGMRQDQKVVDVYLGSSMKAASRSAT